MFEEKMFRGKVSLVTGSTRGIGREIALGFAKLGSHVIVNGRSNNEHVKILQQEIEAFGVKCLPIIGDVSNESFILNSYESILKEFDSIDILVNNAGIAKDDIFLSMSYQDFKQVLDVNLGSVFLFTKAVLPKMIENRTGKIINISSVSGIYGNKGQSNYAAAKAGINVLTKTLAKEVGRYNVQVNAIAPGYVETEILDGVSPVILKTMKKNSPMRRFAKTSEIANLVYFLASDMCNYLHGETIVVDGGGAVF